jgi:hypothetical protein
MQEDIAKPRLARIVRDDESIALAGVEPLHPPANTYRFLMGIGFIETVTRHAAPLARPFTMAGRLPRITVFSRTNAVNH